ncbi:MAG TPA: HAD family phosphatase [Flavihumibacter sp.]|nr:HAD family phosphatase [Bacteroidota bacterium]HOA36809.1 HAD family phosphatase [Flavihumibacter sp.]HPZ86686.1 HAD family phosphatase [Flavihumibacter sp.]HQD08296.1 HAD family phosphatase [Flavihumibacter sp.]
MKKILAGYKGFLFDLNGTMIDDMGYHVEAWTKVFNDDLDANLDYDGVKKQMYGKNSEVLERVFGQGRFTSEEMDRIGLEKEKAYQRAYLPALRLIDGLPALLQEAKDAGIKMAIGSAAIPFNIDFVLDNLSIRAYFDAIVSADDVVMSKPNPEVYLQCAALLGLAPADCLVFEDAPKGVEAAANAGMKAVVILTLHQQQEFDAYDNVIAFVNNYTELE